jgi:hypothetical protein
MKIFQQLGLGLVIAAGACNAMAADTYANATVSGQIKPGVYGRVDVGNQPPPPVYTTQPIIVQRRPVVVVPGQVVVPVQPMYIYAPPGHRKHWAKHCHRYNACGQPVYFVRVDERRHDNGKHHGGRH